MMLFYKLRPLLRSAQVEKELAALKEDFAKLKEAFDRSVSPHYTESKPQMCLSLTVCHVSLHQVGGEASGGRGAAGGFGSGEE